MTLEKAEQTRHAPRTLVVQKAWTSIPVCVDMVWNGGASPR
jgi:hypothetical protein